MDVLEPMAGRILDADLRMGSGADCAADVSSLLERLTAQGVDRALIFPAEQSESVFESIDFERSELKTHNEWCVDIANTSDRLRPVAVIDSSSIADAIVEAERVIEAGVRAVCLPSGIPPGGISPGHPDLDPLWRVFAASAVPIVLLAESRLNMFRALTWGVEGAGAEMFSLTQRHVMAKNYLTPMVYGGVFDRHPDLTVGCIQLGAGWVGPMAENLDGVAKNWFSKTLSKTLSLKPSEYIERNVRVSCAPWEPVDQYIERYGLDDVYVYGSAQASLGDHAELAQRLGPTLADKLFTANAQKLLL